jgi:hypothetical protein
MSADRELLELAAKAAGIVVVRSRLDDPLSRDMLIERSPRNPHQTAGQWNPITDDGDALRLAVRLGLEVYHSINCDAWTAFAGYPCDGTIKYAFEPYGDDPGAATRCAIVLAAAEIGRALTSATEGKKL